MAPIRQYLRISKYSVLECRIFLENPADGPRWLLNPQDPALPRVFEAIKPLVLPKLREENERTKSSKGKKKKSVKDVVQQGQSSVLRVSVPCLRCLCRRFRSFHIPHRNRHSAFVTSQEQNIYGEGFRRQPVERSPRQRR